MRLLNGELDCQFNRYDLFAGKRNDHKFGIHGKPNNKK